MYDVYLRARPRKGAGHMFCMSMSASGAGKVMMMRCHHWDQMKMRCRRVDIHLSKLTVKILSKLGEGGNEGS